VKVAPLVALNVLLVGAGLVAYDVVRGVEPAGDDPHAALAEQLDLLQERVDDVERRVAGAGRGDGERRVSPQVLDIEARVAALEKPRALPATSVAPARAPEAAAAAAPEAARDAPISDVEVERVRLALERLEQRRERERAARMLDGLLDRLGVALAEEQKQRLADELNAYRDGVRESLRGARESGLSREDVTAAMDDLRAGFTTRLELFMDAADAKAVSDEIGSSPRMLMGGPGGPGSGFGGFPR